MSILVIFRMDSEIAKGALGLSVFSKADCQLVLVVCFAKQVEGVFNYRVCSFLRPQMSSFWQDFVSCSPGFTTS